MATATTMMTMTMIISLVAAYGHFSVKGAEKKTHLKHITTSILSRWSRINAGRFMPAQSWWMCFPILLGMLCAAAMCSTSNGNGAHELNSSWCKNVLTCHLLILYSRNWSCFCGWFMFFNLYHSPNGQSTNWNESIVIRVCRMTNTHTHIHTARKRKWLLSSDGLALEILWLKNL